MNVMFHQLNVSPHVAPLAEALASQGHRVVFVAYGEVTSDRVRLGWRNEITKGCEYRFILNEPELIDFLKVEATKFEHICQGFRANGLVSCVQEYCRKRGIGFFVTSEVVNDKGIFGFVKRYIYRRSIGGLEGSCKGVLAIGAQAPLFFEKMGVPIEKIYDFAYFVRDYETRIVAGVETLQCLRTAVQKLATEVA